MPDYEPLDYRLRCHSKRTDLPPDVLRDICEAYEYMELLRDELTERIHMCDMRSEKILELTDERDLARREVCRSRASCIKDKQPEEIADSLEWDCFKNAPVVKTLKGVVVSKGKALPPKFELGDDDK
jgi:hypothetical protein